jgi:hypothetical protein
MAKSLGTVYMPGRGLFRGWWWQAQSSFLTRW